MRIVIDKDSMIKIIAIPLYVASGGDYDKATKTANELLEEMGYTELIEVLDKIRAEIEALNPVDYVSMSSYEGHRGASDMKDDMLRIIDKYKVESEEDMNEVGVEIVKTEEVEESGIKYLNINVSDDEVERNPDIVRICADAGILEYVKPKTRHWITQWNAAHQKEYYYCSECREEFSYDGETGIKMNNYDFCPNCGAKMFEPQESEDEG